MGSVADNREDRDPYLGVPVEAAGYFRVRWSGKVYEGSYGRIYGGILISSIVAMVATFVAWLVPRLRSKLPPYSYVAVTTTDVHILEIRQGHNPTVRRRIGTWPIASLRGRQISPWCVSVTLDGRDVELESTEHSPEAARLIRLISSPA